jgi:hypothetical protein
MSDSGDVIQALTPEQEALMSVYVDRWTAFGLSTEASDRPRAEAAMRKAYERAGFEPPTQIDWYRSPDALRAALREVRQEPAFVDSFGESGWLAFYAFMGEVLGKSAEVAELDGLMELHKSAGCWAALEGRALIADRPLVLRYDEDWRPHSETGPAIAYGDGLGTRWAWHGVWTEQWIIEEPEKITAQKCIAEDNGEIRRVMLERMGSERFIAELGAEKIQADDFGTLWHAPYRDGEVYAAVQVHCPSTEREYWLRVDPLCETAREAVAQSFGMGAIEYEPEVET